METMFDIEALKGTWNYVNGDDMDEYLKEIGVGRMGRMMVKSIKPRLVITENNGTWTIRTETPLRTLSLDLKPGIEYEETTPDGRHLRGVLSFEGGRWIQRIHDQNGKLSVTTRWVDKNDYQQIILECGKVRVHRTFRRE